MNPLPPSAGALQEAPAESVSARCDRPRHRTVLWVCVLLAVGVAAVYWPVTRHQFINYDEPDYVTGNSQVQAGLTAPGIVWAFTTGHANNWHPLTWLSHMLDCQLFGMNAGAHHLTNVLLHIANTVLLFVALRRMTRLRPTSAWHARLRPTLAGQAGRDEGAITDTLWPCAMVAALFGLHPLHVESVAWVSERKDVLSTFFFMLTLLSYASYVQSPSKVQSSKSKVQSLKAEREGSKPENRPNSENRNPSQEEQAPIHCVSRITHHASRFYLLALIFFACGLMSKPMLVTMPFVLLLLDFWPLQRLSINDQGPTIKKLLMEKAPFLALAAGSSVVTWMVQGRDGNIASLDSIPIGLRIENALVSYVVYLKKMFWPVDLAVFYPHPGWRKLQAVVAAALLLGLITALVVASVRRRPYLAVGWLWYLGTLMPVIGLVQVGTQALADRYTYIPLIGIFLALTWSFCDLGLGLRHGRVILAPLGVAVLGICSLLTAAQLRFWKDSETLFRHTLAVTTNNLTAELNLGSALYVEGKIDEASLHFKRALSLKPGYAEAQSNLGLTLAAKGKFAEAIELYRAALTTRPRLAQTHWLLGSALSAEGVRAEAGEEYEKAIELNPDHALALNDLAWLRASASEPKLRNGAEAVALAERACRLTQFGQAQLIGTLAAAYAEAGRFDEAVKTATKARELAMAMGEAALAEKNRQLLEFYRSGKPFHEEALPAKNAN